MKRRDFMKKTGIGCLGLGILPKTTKAEAGFTLEQLREAKKEIDKDGALSDSHSHIWTTFILSEAQWKALGSPRKPQEWYSALCDYWKNNNLFLGQLIITDIKSFLKRGEDEKTAIKMFDLGWGNYNRHKFRINSYKWRVVSRYFSNKGNPTCAFWNGEDFDHYRLANGEWGKYELRDDKS